MKDVFNKSELQNAINNGETYIVCHGSIASELRSKKEKCNTAKKVGVGLALFGLALAPFTMGTSLGVTAMGLTAGSFTISAAELAIIAGGSVAIYGIHKGYDIELQSDGSVVVKAK